MSRHQREAKSLNKQIFANQAARLLNAKTKGRQAVTAIILLIVVLLAGGVLARHVYQMREELSKSQLIETLAAPSEKGRLAQTLADPEASELLMRYIDAMAGAVSSLQLSPKCGLSQFFTLLDASRGCNVQIGSFLFESDGQSMDVSCSGGDQIKFLEQLEIASSFSNIEEIAQKSNAEEYTIRCYFPT